MTITDDLATFHAFEASPSQIVGYHSSVCSACAAIDKLGFLPNKIFPLEDHNALIWPRHTRSIPPILRLGWPCDLSRSRDVQMKPSTTSSKEVQGGKA